MKLLLRLLKLTLFSVHQETPHMDSFLCCFPCTGERGPVRRKIVLLGSSGVGKSCLLLRLLGAPLHPGHVSTIMDLVKLDIRVDSREVLLEVWDTPGTEDLDRLRTLSYPDTDVVLLCFSLDARASLDGLQDFWIPFIHHFFIGVPLVLVGTKADLRVSPETPEGRALTEAIRRLATDLEVAFYRDTSALTGENIRELFYEAIKITLGCCHWPRKFRSNMNSEEVPLLAVHRAS